MIRKLSIKSTGQNVVNGWMAHTPKSIAALIVMLVLFAGSAACASIDPNAAVVHVEKTLQGSFIRLVLNADVVLPSEKTMRSVYSTDYAMADSANWNEMFFGNANAPVKDELVGLDLDSEQIYHPDLEHMVSIGERFTRYAAHEARLFVTYRDVDSTACWGSEKEDAQAVGLQTTPETAKRLAQDWTMALSRLVGWNGLELQACYTMPPFDHSIMGVTAKPHTTAPASKGFYIVEYKRVLEGIPVASDKAPYLDETKANIYGDVIDLMIDDEGIFRVTGYYRSYQKEDRIAVTISLEDAIQIVQDNMDYVIFDNEASTFEITEIELCYRLVQTLPTYDRDALARTQARPVWRFATTINRNMFEEFVIFVDAVTGEIVP